MKTNDLFQQTLTTVRTEKRVAEARKRKKDNVDRRKNERKVATRKKRIAALIASAQRDLQKHVAGPARLPSFYQYLLYTFKNHAHTETLRGILHDLSQEGRRDALETAELLGVPGAPCVSLKGKESYKSTLLLTSPNSDNIALALICPHDEWFRLSTQPPDLREMTVNVVRCDYGHGGLVESVMTLDYWNDPVIDRALQSFSKPASLFRMLIERFGDPEKK